MKRVLAGALALGIGLCSVAYAAPVPSAEKGAAVPAPISVAVSVNKRTFSIGEPVVYRLTVKANPEIEVEFADPDTETMGPFELRDTNQDTRSFFGRRIIRRKYVFAAFETGRFPLPEIKLTLRAGVADAWRAIPLAKEEVEIKSLLTGGTTTADIRKIKGPVWMFLMSPAASALFLGLLAACIGLLVYVRRRRKQQDEKQPQRSAHEIAFERLDALNARNLVAQGRIKEYCSELSAILREYLENRFQVRAEEMTTEEFLVYAKQSADLDDGQKGLLKDFLGYCDLVKFARYASTGDEISAAEAGARRFIEQTKQEPVAGQ